jgi:hypothetical protein
MNEILINLAKFSPRHYRDMVLKRNQLLLAKLQLLKPYVGFNVMAIPDSVMSEVMTTVAIGCPHCLALTGCIGCGQCMWKIASRGNTCLGVDFSAPDRGLLLTAKRLSDITRTLRIHYCRSIAYIGIDHMGISPYLSQTEYTDCEQFLHAHIEWAQLDCWGETNRPGLLPELSEDEVCKLMTEDQK